MKILITGIAGFVGSHLADYLLSLGHEVYGTTRHRSDLKNITHIQNKIKLYDCNISDSISVMQTIKTIKPDVISHLAAQSFVPTSWKAPQDTMNVNVIGTINILEAVREYYPKCIVHIAGSSEEYGVVLEEETPIRESQPLKPLSPYGVSKVAQDLLGQQYYKSYKLPIIISRAFNHEGPRRGSVFVTSDFARQIVAIENGEQDDLQIGNLDAVRDFTDVRDMVKAYWCLINSGLYGEPINIASCKGITIRKLLDLFMEFSILPKETFKIKQSLDKMRPSDVPILIGDNTKMMKLGWENKIPLETTIRDILEYWREQYERG